MSAVGSASGASATRPAPPLWLLAQVTYRCPLHCVYCSNPVQLAATQAELSTDEWRKIFQQAGKREIVVWAGHGRCNKGNSAYGPICRYLVRQQEMRPVMGTCLDTGSALNAELQQKRPGRVP